VHESNEKKEVVILLFSCMISFSLQMEMHFVHIEIRKDTCSNCKIVLCSTNENDNTKLFSRYLKLRHKKLLKYIS
jgi:hypothetical protein